MQQELSFQDVFLKPTKECIADSRDTDCDPSVKFGKHTFKCPVVPANMKSVVNSETCEFLSQHGWFYIKHRFGVNNLAFTKHMHNKGYIASISVGVNEDSYEQLTHMKSEKVYPDYITIDVANADSAKTERTVKFIKDNFPDAFLIVGNYASEEACIEIEKWGADATKAGIATGKVCTTYLVTGFARPQFSTVLECSKVAKKPLISDGGIRNISDISKAMVAGASMVMAGSLFAGYKESAGEIVKINGKEYKQYYGSASYNNTLSNKHVEGECELIEYKGEMSRLLQKIEDGVRSAISYAGGKDLSAFQNQKWGYGNVQT